MQRLTSAERPPFSPAFVESTWRRLRTIEDILGEDYDLRRLKALVTGDNYTEEDMSAAYTSGYETGRKRAEDKTCGPCPAIHAVKAMAASDLVPVVRCRDCKWYQIRKWDDGKPEYDCRKTQGLLDVRPEDFCSYGERRAADD